MGTSAKRKREKKQDFQKPKLKVGKSRPKNTNATDTSFSAKSIHLQQQTLTSTSSRDPSSLLRRNLSLLTAAAETQRRDALSSLTSAILSSPPSSPLPIPPSTILSRSLPLLFDPSAAVRSSLLKLLRALPAPQLGDLADALLWTRAGLVSLSAGVRESSLEALEWVLEARGARVLGAAPGGWVKTLRTFQGVLGWAGMDGDNIGGGEGKGKAQGGWSAVSRAQGSGSGRIGGGGKLLVRQISVLARFLTVGLERGGGGEGGEAARARRDWPVWRAEGYVLPERSRAYGYLNLFGAPRDVEGEVYDDPEERAEVFVELGMEAAFRVGVRDAKREGGEVGRAAAMVEKALRLVGEVG